MKLEPDDCYRALQAKDARFDGVFFTCVSTTGIYCRPVCRAKLPRRDRCTFVRTAAEAERAGFRACLRCRPELAPGAGHDDAIPRLVADAVRLIERGWLNQRIAGSTPKEIASIGIPLSRAASIRAIAAAVVSGAIRFEPCADPLAVIEALAALPGVGPWTAQYLAMRALRWPDAFPAGDLGIAKALRMTTAQRIEMRAEPWRPWRAYAAVHLWSSLTPAIPSKRTGARS